MLHDTRYCGRNVESGKTLHRQTPRPRKLAISGGCSGFHEHPWVELNAYYQASFKNRQAVALRYATMKVNFPNPSRSFDPGSNRVRFWGYDSAMEISFFVDAAALKRLCPDMGDAEAGLLKAFDTARARIYEVADKVYGRGRQGSYAYSLTAKEF